MNAIIKNSVFLLVPFKMALSLYTSFRIHWTSKTNKRMLIVRYLVRQNISKVAHTKNNISTVCLSRPILRIELEETCCWSFDWANGNVLAIGTTNGDFFSDKS